MERLEILAEMPERPTANGVLCVLDTRLPGGADPAELLKNTGISAKPTANGEICTEKVEAQQYIWTAGPEWRDDDPEVIRALAEAYRAVLTAAEAAGLETVDLLAVPTGVYDPRLFQIATTTLQAVRAFQLAHETPKTVRLLCAEDREVMTYKQAYNFWFADTKAARMDYPGWD